MSEARLEAGWFVTPLRFVIPEEPSLALATLLKTGCVSSAREVSYRMTS
jgi:hypothetical protein